jgi:hypothetical protein
LSFKKIALDDLTAAELRTLDQGQQLALLSELLGAIKYMGELKCDAIDVLALAKMKCLTDLVDGRPKPENKSEVVKAKAPVDKLTIMISARKQQSSTLQTMIRSGT